MRKSEVLGDLEGRLRNEPIYTTVHSCEGPRIHEDVDLDRVKHRNRSISFVKFECQRSTIPTQAFSILCMTLYVT